MIRTTLLAASAALMGGVAVADSQQCAANGPVSCSSSSVSDTCCTPAPGGQLLHVQLWDGGSDTTGPADSWTIHGLWPDNCDGTYDENCDQSRAYSNITEILQSHGKSDLVSYMNEYWLSDSGSAEMFWAHEWNTHGTCISTFDPTCYTAYRPQQEMVDFFQYVTDQFKSINTYQILSDAGITPDSSQTYAASEIEDALARAHGAPVVVSCKSGRLYQVEYFFHYQGSVQTGQAISVTPSGASSNCKGNVRYLPKTN